MTLPVSSDPWIAPGEYEDLVFVEANFSRLNLVGTRFSRVKFVRCIFEECELSHASFSACDIYDCTFHNCMLYFCQLDGCELTKTRFMTSYLSGIRIRGCDLTRTRFGQEFQVGANRKIKAVPKDGLPIDVLTTAHAATIPAIGQLEQEHAGVAVEGCSWFLAFIPETNERRRHRRRSVLTAHLANQLLAYGRGDSAQYHYLARHYAMLAEPKWSVRLVLRFEDWLWGYGYRPLRLLRTLLIVNALAIGAYLIFTALGWGQLKDNDVTVSGVGIHSVASYVYYCIVVATTLGFGDVLPYGGCRAILGLQILANIALVAMWLSGLTSPNRGWSIPELSED